MFDQLHCAGAFCHVSDHTMITVHTQHWALQSYTRESMREGCIINILMFLTARFKQFAQYLKWQGIEVLSEPLCVFAYACVCVCLCLWQRWGGGGMRVLLLTCTSGFHAMSCFAFVLLVHFVLRWPFMQFQEKVYRFCTCVRVCSCIFCFPHE